MNQPALAETIRRNHYQEVDPGTVWVKDAAIAIPIDDRDSYRVLTPNVVTLPQGGYRMYYCGGSQERKEQGVAGYVMSAFSTDGEAWVKDAGIRVDARAPDAEEWAVCPDVVVLPEGGYRMYFQARSAAGRHTILSAVSGDGLDWTREAGIRFADADSQFGSPRVLPLEDGRWRLYCHEYPQPFRTGVDAGNRIISAISSDGREFVREPGARIEQENELEAYAVYAPEVLRLGDGAYRMYYAGWSENPVEGRIFSATSQDGLRWIKDPGICLDNGGPYQESKVSEPCVTRLPDGRFRLFYEANDRHGDWRILSATTPGPKITPSRSG
jgi:predicted GH43/DUF377 family glycosyl hydrolase